MAGLIVEIVSRPNMPPCYRHVGGEELTIGRAYDNDVIVPDPYIGAHQLRLIVAGDGLRAEVLDRSNALYRNGRVEESAALLLRTGDRLLVGHTRVRVLSESAPVVPARPMLDTRWARLGPWRGVLALAMVLLTASYAFFFDYQETVVRVDWLQLATSVLFLILIVVAWSVGWALAGRLLRHRAQFASQLFVSSAMTWLMMQVTLAAAYLDYASNIAVLAEGFDWVMSALVSVLLLYYNLHLATNLRRPLAVASGVVLGLFAVVFAIELVQRRELGGLPTLDPTLKPPMAKLRRGEPLEGKLEELATLFAEARDAL